MSVGRHVSRVNRVSRHGFVPQDDPLILGIARRSGTRVCTSVMEVASTTVSISGALCPIVVGEDTSHFDARR